MLVLIWDMTQTVELITMYKDCTCKIFSIITSSKLFNSAKECDDNFVWIDWITVHLDFLCEIVLLWLIHAFSDSHQDDFSVLIIMCHSLFTNFFAFVSSKNMIIIKLSQILTHTSIWTLNNFLVHFCAYHMYTVSG